LGETIPADAPLMWSWLDSIGSVEVRNAMASNFGVELPAAVAFASVEALEGLSLGGWLVRWLPLRTPLPTSDPHTQCLPPPPPPFFGLSPWGKGVGGVSAQLYILLGI